MLSAAVPRARERGPHANRRTRNLAPKPSSRLLPLAPPCPPRIHVLAAPFANRGLVPTPSASSIANPSRRRRLLRLRHFRKQLPRERASTAPTLRANTTRAPNSSCSRRDATRLTNPHMAGEGVAPVPPRKPEVSNRDWRSCTKDFREAADKAIEAMDGQNGIWLATQLAVKYPESPLAHNILVDGYRKFNSRPLDRFPVGRAAELAQHCPHIAYALADVLNSTGMPNQAVEVCDGALVDPEPTDPALHLPCLSEDIKPLLDYSDSGPEFRIAIVREQIRGLRAKAEKGKGDAVLPDVALAPMWTPKDTNRARARWSRMSEEERDGFLSMSVGDMKSYCRSAVVPELSEDRMMRVLSGFEEFVKVTRSWYWLCPVCRVVFVDSTVFMQHIECAHIKEDEKLRSSVPPRIPDSEKELLKSWRWDPINGDDFAERAEILSMIKGIIFQLIDLKAISVNLLHIVYKFIMSRVRGRAAIPSVVSMCASCAICQLSSADLRELYGLLELLPHHLTDCEHEKGHVGEQESLEGSFVTITVFQDSCVLSFDREKIAPRSTDGSSQADALFTWLFCEPLHGDPLGSWVSMWQNCIDHGIDVLNSIGVALKLLQEKCCLHDELQQIQGGVYFLPEAILAEDIDTKLYFSSGIGSVQVDMLQIDAELDWLKKNLLECCKVDYLAVILPVAKACLWAKLNNNPLGDALRAGQPTPRELQLSSDVILRSLWHIRRFHDEFQKIPSVRPDVTVVGDQYIVCLLGKIFRYWDDKEERKAVDSLIYMEASFRSILSDEKVGKITASGIVKLILQKLHTSQTPLHFEFDSETLKPQTISTPSCLDCICLTHNLFGLHINEKKKCSCVNAVPTKKEYTTFFHNIDMDAVERTELKSFDELLKAAGKQFLCDRRIGGCGNKIDRYLSYPPHLFITVFSWPSDKGSHLNMHEVLMSIAAELDISLVYKDLHSESMYTLVSAVCCAEDGQYHCFARGQNEWVIYNGETVEAAYSWQDLLRRYSQTQLRPDVLFFERIK